MRTDLEKRERIVKNSELNQASREEEIRSLQRQVQSDKESLELQRTEMISLREKVNYYAFTIPCNLKSILLFSNLYYFNAEILTNECRLCSAFCVLEL